MKRIFYCLFLLIFLFVILGCTKVEKKKTYPNEVVQTVKVIIQEEEYLLHLEENETAKSFLEQLPQEFTMTELNGNEKYSYLNEILPTNPYYPQRIYSGDLMLYGNNCLVLFYQSFDTSYSYTKIGHVEDLADLGNENILVKFEK